ncbi:MAG: OmpA family protein [Rhodobacteraceae bacterium]|nr:OmpA family protein [Paracoccaceae bacterium]
MPRSYLTRAILLPATLVVAALLSLLAASWAATVVEQRSADGVDSVLQAEGFDWAAVEADGLQLTLTGTAPTEAARFRALAAAGTVVDSNRLIDAMGVSDAEALKAPDYTVEILRNDDGISLIGLVPDGAQHDALVAQLGDLAGAGKVIDMLETAAHPVPDNWQASVDYGIRALAELPRSKISISAGKVAVTAISDSPQEKARLESRLKRATPRGLVVALDISAPRPVIAPFTLRFLIDADGPRFDACAADSEQARDQILAAAAAAGAPGASCTIGLGVPTPAWSEAVTLGLKALAELGAGSITYSDADISLIAAESVDQATFDRVVGELESGLPEVFSLHATLTPKPAEANTPEVVPEFTATLDAEGRLALRGRIGSELTRDAVENFARAKFGGSNVTPAMRITPDLPGGWAVRLLAALEALGELHDGSAKVRPDLVTIAGVTGAQGASDAAARILSSKLGEGANFKLEIRYDPKLDPLLGLPTAEECAAEINAILASHKINFEPGSAQITPDAAETLDKVAARMKDCTDFPMEIGGYTDSQGREEMNLALSRDRAQAVLTSLMDRRVLTGNLTAVGYGEENPIADNGTEAGREANRRIEFRLLTTTGTPEAGTATETAPEAAPGAASETAGEAAGTATSQTALPADAGSADTGSVDAGSGDAGSGDAGSGDAGSGDAGSGDGASGDFATGGASAGTDLGSGDELGPPDETAGSGDGTATATTPEPGVEPSVEPAPAAAPAGDTAAEPSGLPVLTPGPETVRPRPRPQKSN